MCNFRHHLPVVDSSHLIAPPQDTLHRGKSGLSNKPIFPQPPCPSQQQKHSKEPEAHASGACLFPADQKRGEQQQIWGFFSASSHAHSPSSYAPISTPPTFHVCWLGFCDIPKREKMHDQTSCKSQHQSKALATNSGIVVVQYPLCAPLLCM